MQDYTPVDLTQARNVGTLFVSPDTEPRYLPKDGDRSQPSVVSAMTTGRGRSIRELALSVRGSPPAD